MFNIMETDIWDDMWRQMDAFANYPFKDKSNLKTIDLKSVIHRPHNIVNVKDNSGKIVAQRLEVVTTPFAKNDVKVTIDNNILSVNCGTNTKEESKTEEYIYKGISSQSYTFAVKLNDKIDKKSIKAKNTDGVLTVTLPFKKEEEKEDATVVEVE